MFPSAIIFFIFWIGESWQESIYHAFDNAKCVVALLSPEYFKSNMCNEELNLALVQHLSNVSKLLNVVIIKLNCFIYILRIVWQWMVGFKLIYSLLKWQSVSGSNYFQFLFIIVFNLLAKRLLLFYQVIFFIFFFFVFFF